MRYSEFDLKLLPILWNVLSTELNSSNLVAKNSPLKKNKWGVCVRTPISTYIIPFVPF